MKKNHVAIVIKYLVFSTLVVWVLGSNMSIVDHAGEPSFSQTFLFISYKKTIFEK
jgi:hypothetical protein